MALEDAISIFEFSSSYTKNPFNFRMTPDHRPVQFCYGLRQNPNAASAVFNLVQWYINNAPLVDYWRNDAVALLGSLSCLNDDNQIAQ